MSSSPMISSTVKDFLQSFYEAVSWEREYEITRIVEHQWQEFSSDHFKDEPWPAPEVVAPLAKNDPVFTMIYRALYYKHLLMGLSSKRFHTPGVFVAAWKAYERILAFLKDRSQHRGVRLPAEWVYSVLSEMLYIQAKYTEARSTDFSLDDDEVIPSAGSLSSEINESEASGSIESVWSLAQLLLSLHSIVELSDIRKIMEPDEMHGHIPHDMLAQAGYFALVCLCRMHAKLGDYATALRMAAPIDISQDSTFSRVPKCHIMLLYSIGFSLVMTRRFANASQLFSRVLLYFHRTRHGAGGGILKKKSDQMLALLAICAVVCPGIRLDEQVTSMLRDSHRDSMERLGRGDVDELDDVFERATPKFVDPDPTRDAREMHNVQLRQLKQEVSQRLHVLPGLRSYLRLYTNIDTEKLAGFTKSTREQVHNQLQSLKLKSYQRYGEVGGPSDGAWMLTDPLQFHVEKDVVSATEEQDDESAAVGEYFLRHIAAFGKMQNDLSRAARK